MNSSIILILAFCIISNVSSQTPASEYYNQIILAEQALIEGDLKTSVSIYQDAFEKFNFPFSKHIQQGLFVACYANNLGVAKLFLGESVMNGMTKDQFNYFNDLWNRNNSESKLDLDYDSTRFEAMKKLDTTLLFKFLEIDAFREIVLDNLKMRDSLSTVIYFSGMRNLRDKYMQTIELEGYPEEKTVGTPWKWKLIKRMKRKYKASLAYKLPKEKWSETKYKYIIVQHPRRLISFKPGNWFLTHYINSEDESIIDSTLFHILKLGFDSLKIDPLIMVNALESTREPSNEFALSYYSRLWAYKLKFSYVEKFALKGNERSIINSNRAYYHIRSLEQEELLFKALYKLKYSEAILEKITKKNTDDLKSEISLFLNIYK